MSALLTLLRPYHFRPTPPLSLAQILLKRDWDISWGLGEGEGLAGDSQRQQECLTGLWTVTVVKGNCFC